MAGNEWVVNRIEGGLFLANVVQGRDITVNLPPDPVPALAGIPPVVDGFFGRDRPLRDLLETFADSAARAVVVTGMAGVGKTELALQACHAALAAGLFPGGVLFADLRGHFPAAHGTGGDAADAVDWVLEGFLRALGVVEARLPAGIADRERLYRTVLAGYADVGRRVLVVLDNAVGEDVLAPLLPGPRHFAIVTSRESLGMVDARLVALDVLAEQDAIAMIREVAERAHGVDRRFATEPDAARELARLCGGLPLALRIIGALLVDDRARPLTALAADLADGRERLAELRYGAMAVRSAFALSYARLEAEEARLFALLGAHPGVDLPTEAVVALAGLDYDEGRRCLERLARAHLVEHGAGYGRWRVHDLVRLYAEELLDARDPADGRAAAFTRLVAGYLGTVAAVRLHLDGDPGAGTRVFTSRAEALEWLDAEYATIVVLVHAAAAQGRSEDARDLVLLLDSYVALRRRYTDWRALTEVAATAARALGDRLGEAHALNGHGVALWEEGRYVESANAQRRSAGLYRDAGDRLGEAKALANMADGLGESGRLAEAIAQVQTAIPVLDAEGGDADDIASAWTILGRLLLRTGQVDEALAAYRKAIDIASGSGSGAVAAVGLSGVASASAMIEEFEQTIDAARTAVELARDAGDRHVHAHAQTVLALALMESGRPEDAVESFRQAADRYTELDLRERLAEIHVFLAQALHLAGRPDSAVASAETAVAAFREFGPPEDLREALALLAELLDGRERRGVVTGLWREAYALWSDADDLAARTKVLESLGRSMTKGGGPADEAVAMLQEAARNHRTLGDEHGAAAAYGLVGTAWKNQADIAAFSGQFDDHAVAAMLTAWRAEADACGRAGDPAAEAHARNRLGHELDVWGHHAEALVELDAAHALFHEAGDAAGQAEAVNRKGLALRHLGRLHASVDAHLTALRIFRDLDHTEGQATAHGNLGYAYAAFGHLRAARTHFGLSIEIFNRLGDMESSLRANAQLNALRNPLRTLPVRLRRVTRRVPGSTVSARP